MNSESGGVPTSSASVTLAASDSSGHAGFSQTLSLPVAFLARYELGDPLGQGGCGVAIRARNRTLGRTVAIKLLLKHDDPSMVRRFLQEAQLLGSINHPNVVTVYDFQDVDGHPCLVMELVEGGSLRERLDLEGRLPVVEALQLAATCLSGLHACHGAGVVHRDLKPENILLARQQTPKIADLGIGSWPDNIAAMTGLMLDSPPRP